jgi:Fe-S-cluster-containing hydrogenase component 2
MAAIVDKEKCTGCGSCVEICPIEAISVVDDIAVIDAESCIDCGTCIDECPNEAIQAEQ